MKTYRKELWFEVPTRRAFINITRKVEECLGESGIREGFILVKCQENSVYTPFVIQGTVEKAMLEKTLPSILI